MGLRGGLVNRVRGQGVASRADPGQPGALVTLRGCQWGPPPRIPTSTTTTSPDGNLPPSPAQQKIGVS